MIVETATATDSYQPTMSWEDDYETRTNPGLLTHLLRKAVPILDYLDFQVLETRPGYVRTRLPLSQQSANQHGVHQAAVLAIAADYAGGIALGSLTTGAPIIGVHPQTTDNGASLWAVSLKIDYKLPSSASVFVSARVPEDRHEKIKSRYFKGRMVLETVEVTLETEDELFATASITYFIRQARSLRPQSVEATPNAMFTHKRRASARLIAGLRAMESASETPLYADSFSAPAAGDHGALLANRFQEASPQLKDMVANRTRDIDDLVLQHPSIRQLVLVGAGFDFRPFRLRKHLENVTVFEVDLPAVLLEREKLVAQLVHAPLPARVPVACNLELQDVLEELVRADFDPALPTVFVLEGVTMYFDEGVNARLLRALAAAMQSPDSRLWMDVVDQSVIDRTAPYAEVSRFLDGIEGLGEPFIWGPPDSRSYFGRFGLSVAREVPSDRFRPSDDPVFDLYRFCTLRPC